MKRILIFWALFFVPFQLRAGDEKSQLYYCPMHPSYTSAQLGQCPICHMDLVLKEQDGGGHEHSKNTRENRAGIINVPSDFLRKFGIKTQKAVKKRFSVSIYLPGNVSYDRDLYELLNEYKNVSLVKDSFSSGENNSFKDLLDSSLLKLKIYGISKDIAGEMLSAGISPLISPSDTAYAYFYADEKYIPLIKEGDPVIVETQIKKKSLKGRVLAVGGAVDEFRKAKIIVLVEDKGALFTPGMYLYGKFDADRGEKLVIGEDSYIENGEEDLVYVEKERGKYEIRKIKTVFSSGGYTEVAAGLKEGEKIISPAFLIDSEARLKGVYGDSSSGAGGEARASGRHH